jgi:hypothetical protein
MPPKNFHQRSKKAARTQPSAAKKKRLGLDRPITRRDFLKGMLVGAGALMLLGCAGLGSDSENLDSLNLPPEKAYFDGNTKWSIKNCHRVRAEEPFFLDREDTSEIYDLVIVGAGLGGLTAAGFDPAEDIEGIAINRWGHAEIICYPGFAFGSGSSDEPIPGVPIYDAGQRFGRIAFAHTDLNGIADNQGTTRISRRAVDDLLG